MKCTVAVAGAGRQGLCAAYDAARLETVGRVRLVDADAGRLSHAIERLEELGAAAEITPVVADARDRVALLGAFEGANGVVSAVPYGLGPGVCEAAVEAGASAVDLGGNPDASRRIADLGSRARARGVIVAPDCGLAPGLGNVLGGWAVDALTRAGGRDIEVEIRCGGLPREPRNALGYQMVFSFGGLANEYDGEAALLRGGELATEPTLEEITPWSHEKLGALECAPTSGGTSSAPGTFRGRVRGYRYRTVRYPGHFAFFRTLKKLGCLAAERREALRALLEPVLTVAEPDDLVILRVDAKAAGAPAISRELLDYRDAETGFTAMERTTAYPTVAVLELALEGRLAPGAIRLEADVPFDDYFARLDRRGLRARS
ncbi:MAG TPA: saccharopine dehydrogenase C-terminal domain-containing protein [Planctomycetota bacterium]|nr:saccharopine dehydrogenase C-terminal domain-containing protein [Planctomycetota bacterium]